MTVAAVVVSQVYAASSKRTELMRELVTSEAGCMHRAFLLVDALQEVLHAPSVQVQCSAIVRRRHPRTAHAPAASLSE